MLFDLCHVFLNSKFVVWVYLEVKLKFFFGLPGDQASKIDSWDVFLSFGNDADVFVFFSLWFYLEVSFQKIGADSEGTSRMLLQIGQFLTEIWWISLFQANGYKMMSSDY